VRDALPGLGHAVELRVYRAAGVLHVDWWYDTRRVSTVSAEALVRQFPTSLTELISEAIGEAQAGDDVEGEDEALALIDLSAAFAGDDDEY
jgi:phthiocerol/phenolphthiocerol synthesis type-I polyketide synthase E